MRLSSATCLAGTLIALAAPASAVAASSGGAAAPSGGSAPVAGSGGAVPVEAAPKVNAPARGGPVLSLFQLRGSRLVPGGRPVRLRFRIDGPRRLREVRVRLVRVGSRRASATFRLRAVPRRHVRSLSITGLAPRRLATGRYRVRIEAADSRGRKLRRAPGISSSRTLTVRRPSAPAPPPVAGYRFPLLGPFSFGGPDGRFGAGREGHTHQGQDMSAAEGTPVVAPHAGVVEAVQYQASGAGHYVVLDGSGEDRDYVFMHLRSGSIPVRTGQSVRAGQRLGEVGNTGRSFGAHLHLEVWVGGGWYSGGHPIDPLPLLRSWMR